MIFRLLYLVNIFNRLTNSINQGLGIVFFNNHRNDNSKQKKGALGLYALSFLLGLPLAIFTFLYSSQILEFLWGPEWIEASLILKYLAPLIVLLPMFTLMKSQLFGNRHNNTITILYIIGTIILIGGIYLFSTLYESSIIISYMTLGSFFVMLLSGAAFMLTRKN